MTPILKQRRVLAFAEETVAGTPAALVQANALFCYDPMPQSNIPMDEREATGTLDMLAAIAGATAGKLGFEVDYVGGGSGSVKPKWAALLECCGLVANGNVYTPTSDPTNYKTGTFGIYETGTLKTLYGAMGTVTIEGEHAKRCKFKFEFTGIWGPPTDAAVLTPPLPAAGDPLPPRFAGTTFTVGAYTPAISKFSLAAGNTVTLVPDITAASGYRMAVVTKRKWGGSIDPLATLVGTYDWWGHQLASTTAAMSLVIGTAAGNTVTIAAPAFQVMDPQEGNRSDLVTTDVKFGLAAGATPDTAVSITFG